MNLDYCLLKTTVEKFSNDVVVSFEFLVTASEACSGGFPVPDSSEGSRIRRRWSVNSQDQLRLGEEVDLVGGTWCRPR